MSYEAALKLAWEELGKLNPADKISLKFLADEYTIDCQTRQVLSLSCNAPAKEFSAILILHYLSRKIKGLPAPSGEWLTFRELAGVEGYYPAFRKRAIEPIISKYGANPEGILLAQERLPAKKAVGGDIAVILDVFEGVRALIKLWGQDAEFGPEANIFFDKSIREIFSIEDIIVLAGIIASQI